MCGLLVDMEHCAQVIAEHKMLDEKAQLKRDHAALRGDKVSKVQVLWAELKYFTTAFNDTCYRLLWFQVCV
jgi:hypothetical protein